MRACAAKPGHCMSVVRVTYLVSRCRALSSFDDRPGAAGRAATDGAPTDLGAGMREALDQLELPPQPAHILS
jgi:hypothetical protein